MPAQPWDNPNNRGPADSRYVSLTEPYELATFVKNYLQSRNYAASEENKQIVSNDSKACPLKAPILRTDLESYLDRKYNRTR